MQRPFAVSVLAILNVLGGLALLAFTAIFGVAAAATVPGEPGPGRVVFAVCAVVSGGLAVFQFVTGFGLWTLKNYGRIGQMILSGIGLLAIPVGTIVSGVILYYLSRPGVKLLFSGRPEYSLTPEERQVVAHDANQALALVIVLIVAVFGGIAMIGIVAAIAIPALLRARIGANEASAIGTVRSVVSAEATWATGHAGAYAAPACLHVPTSCGEPAGGVAYLDRDPTAGEPRSGYRYGFALRAPAAVEAPAQDPSIPNIEGLTPEQLARVIADMQAKADAQAERAANAGPSGYALWAVPSTPGTTGIRSFCAEESGVVLQYGRDAAWSDPVNDVARCPPGGAPVP